MATDPVATFGVSLKDDVSDGAKSAARALLDLKSKIDEDVKALASMKRAMRNLKGDTSTSAETFAKLRDQIAAQKATVAAAQSKYLELGGSFDSIKPPAERAGRGFDDLSDKLSATGGPIGRVGSGMAKLKSLIANPITAILAIGAALVGLAVAAVKAAVALAKYTLAQSDARRSELLRIEGLNTLSRAYGRSTASSLDQVAAMNAAADSTNVSRDKLGEFARQLGRVGLRGRALAQATEAMAIAQQVQGDRGAARFRAMAMNARLTGGSVSDIAERYRRELGPIARREMQSMGNQSERLSRSMSRIFDGLNLDGIGESMEKIVDLFSQTSVTGRALKTIVNVMFQPMIDGAENATPLLVDLFEKGVIGALTFANTVQDLRIRFQVFANNTRDAIDTIKEGFRELSSGEIFGRLFGTIEGAVPQIQKATRDLADGARSGFADALEIRSPSRVFAAFGENISAGIVQGIEGGARSVFNSTKRLADSSAEAFRGALEIRSPSRVFAAYGEEISHGVAGGIDTGAGEANEAAARMVEQPAGGPGGARSGRASGPVSFTFGDIVIGGAGEGAEGMAKAFREELIRALSGVQVEMGAS